MKAQAGAKWCASQQFGGPEPVTSKEDKQSHATESSGPPTIPLWELLGYPSAAKASRFLGFAVGARRVIGEA